MGMDFWDRLGKGFSCLAPMEGVTDIVFRQVVARAGRPDVFFTEFTNVNSYVSEAGRANALERLRFLPEEQPIVAQIWGKVPEYFGETALGLRGMGHGAVDINMGCPDKHVVAGGGGSGLIRTPELAVEIIGATKRVGLPVSVKTRLGYSLVDEWREWLTVLLGQDIAALTVHLRTKKEMSRVGAHFELVPEIVGLRDEISPYTKLIINGDIGNALEGRWFFDLGVDGVMIGRGVFHDPFCFRKDGLGGGKLEQDISGLEYARGKSAFFVGLFPACSNLEMSYSSFLSARIDLLKYHLDLFDEYGVGGFEPLKRFFKVYISGFYGAGEIRERLMACGSTDEVREVVGQIGNGVELSMV